MIYALITTLTLFCAAGQDRKTQATGEPRVRLSCEDFTRGIKVEIYPDGRVEMTVREEDKTTGKKTEKTFKADSLKDFRRQYPDVCRKYDLDRFAVRSDEASLREDVERLVKEWKDRLGDRNLWLPFDPDKFLGNFHKPWEGKDLEAWFQEQRRLFEGMPPAPDKAADSGRIPKGPLFGIRIAPVGEVLASQLDLARGQGLVVMSVVPGSSAEKAGLERNDILLKVNGRTIADPAAFVRDLHHDLSGGFALDILRHGRPKVIEVPGQHS